MRLLVVNPNTTAAATERIGRMARRAASPETVVTAVSAPSGIPLIQTPAQSTRAAAAVVTFLTEQRESYDAAVVAAFTDPGLPEARAAVAKPIVGIAESAMLDAADLGGKFGIVTLGEGLVAPLRALAASYGVADRLTAIGILPAAFSDVAYDPERFEDQFLAACADIVGAHTVSAIVIGGGPLAGLAETLGDRAGVPLFDGVVCAVRRAERALNGSR